MKLIFWGRPKTKPRIFWLSGAWFCARKPTRSPYLNWDGNLGIGPTPEAAYKAWKAHK